MYKVFSRCHFCGRNVSVKLLRIVYMKMVKTDKEKNKFQVCVWCNQKLQTKQGIGSDRSK